MLNLDFIKILFRNKFICILNLYYQIKFTLTSTDNLKVNSNKNGHLQLGRSQLLGPCQSWWRSGSSSARWPGTTPCRCWWWGKRPGSSSSGNDACQPFRSIRDGICRSWSCGDVDHQRYHDLQDAYGAYLRKILLV